MAKGIHNHLDRPEMTYTLQDYLTSEGFNGKITFNNIEPHAYENLELLPAFSGLTLPTESECTAGIAALQAAYDLSLIHI